MRRTVALLAVAAFLLASASGVWWLIRGSAHGAAAAEAPRDGARPPISVLAGRAETRPFPIVIRGIGSAQAFSTVTVKSRVDGNIVKVAYDEGQPVHKGELLVEIDPRPYQAQLEQAEATKAKDAANLENARRDLARDAALVNTNLAVSRQQYDTQKALVAQLAAAVEADQAAIDAAQLNLAYCSITSPIDGVTGLRLVDIGNLVQANAATPLVTITQIKPIFDTFTIPERDLDRVRRAMARGPVTVLAFNSSDDRQLASGLLKVINNSVDQATGTVTLRAEFANRDAALWPGQFVNAHLILKTVKNGVTVPVAAVSMGPTGPFAYVIAPNSTVRVQPVKVVAVENRTALIGAGLKAGDRVVLSGQIDLAPGMRVAVQPSAPGAMIAREPEIGPEGVGSTGINTVAGITGVTPR